VAVQTLTNPFTDSCLVFLVDISVDDDITIDGQVYQSPDTDFTFHDSASNPCPDANGAHGDEYCRTMQPNEQITLGVRNNFRGQMYLYAHAYFNEEISTTEQLISKTVASLPPFSGFDGPHSELGQGTDCSAYRDLSADETSYDIQRFKYKFTFPAATQPFSISWVERFTPAGGGQPTNQYSGYELIPVGATSTVREYMVGEPPSNGTITIEEIVYNVQSLDPNNVTVEEAAPGPSHYLECQEHGKIWTESVDVGVSACFNGTYWRAILTSLKGHYSVLAQLETCPSPQQEVTGPESDGNTTQENYCEQVRTLNGLSAYTPGGWYMLEADYARQYAHVPHLRPTLQSVAPEIGNDIQAITVSAQSEQEAIDLIKASAAFANAKTRALTSWDNAFLPLKPEDDVFGGAGDIAEHEVVDPMISTICAYANAHGWNNTNQPCDVCGPPSTPPPAAPTAAAGTDILSSGFTANWGTVSGATGYRLDISTSSTFASYVSGYQDFDVGTATSQAVSGLTANTTYYYRARAYNTGGTSTDSNVINVTTLPNAPGAPTANAASNITSTGFTANWATVTGAIGYRLDMSTSSAFATYVTGYQDLDVGNGSSQAVSGLNASTIYYYRVRAYNTGGTSANSNAITATTLPNAPDAPTASAATSIANNGFTANWGAVSSATGYRLDVSTSSAFATYVTGYQDLDVPSATTQSVTGLSANTTYYYRVRAYNPGGASGNSNTITVTTLPNPPGAPNATAATSVTSTSFTANWGSVSGATGYKLDVSTSSTFASYVTGYQDLNVGAVASHSVTGLTANTTYYYRVRAYNTGGTSANSNVITVATLPNAPAAPTATAATSVTSSGFIAHWNAATGATGYRLDISTSSTFASYLAGYNNLDLGNVTSRSVTGLSANTTYYYRVRAYNTGGTSANSNVITVATLPNAPAAPVATAATSITTSGFIAHWNAATGATGYRLDISTSSTFASFVTGYNNLDLGNVTSRSVTGLSANTTYYYRLRAYNTGGTSANSNVITVQTAQQVVATPTFNPAGAAVCSHSINVTISTTTTGAQIRYTTDGVTTPTSTVGTLIAASSGTVTLSLGHVTLQAVAFKSGMTTSAVRTGFYDYDCGQGPAP
jgi:autonomous glycyl radical cofactor GrcA